ncbi:hypothetical protein QE418_002342 [Microbacterium testaceum]|nr:hypothetical protein [Microbacterium testaceum]
MLEKHVAVRGDDLHAAGRGDLERLVVAAVLLGRLGHEADIRNRPDGGRIQRTVGDDVLDRRLVHPGVRGVGDHGEGVVLSPVGAPQLAAVADQRRHRGVDDHVARHVQVGDALVAVDVRQAGAGCQRIADLGGDGVAALDVRQTREDRAEAVIGGEARGGESIAVAVEHVGEERLDDVTEDDRVADLHHRGLEMHRVEHVVGLRFGQRVGEESVEGRGREEGGIHDLALEDLQALFERLRGAVGRHVLDREHVVVGEDDRLLVRAEVVVTEGRDAGLRALGERLVAVRVLLRVVLHRERRATVAVALAQHGVHGGSLDAVVAGAHVLVFDARRLVRVVRDVVALRLELGDGRLQLRDGCRDVGQLDDVRLRQRRETAQLGQRVADLLLGGEALREGREDAAGERDVAGLDVDTRLLRDGLHDGQERRGGKCRRLVGVRVDDGGIGHVRSLRRGGQGCVSAYRTWAKSLDIEIVHG